MSVINFTVCATPDDVSTFLILEGGVTREKITMLEFFDEINEIYVETAHEYLRKELVKENINAPAELGLRELIEFRNNSLLKKKLRTFLSGKVNVYLEGLTLETMKEMACTHLGLSVADLGKWIFCHPIPLNPDFSQKRVVAITFNFKHPITQHQLSLEELSKMLGLHQEVVAEAYFRHNKGIKSLPPTGPVPACVTDVADKAARCFGICGSPYTYLARVMGFDTNDVYRMYLNHHEYYGWNEDELPSSPSNPFLPSPVATLISDSCAGIEWEKGSGMIDLASLYPSSMISSNIGHDVLISPSSEETIRKGFQAGVNFACYEDMGHLFEECLALPSDYPTKGTPLEKRDYLTRRKRLQALIKTVDEKQLTEEVGVYLEGSNQDMVTELCKVWGVKKIPKEMLESTRVVTK
jgi:hypothetical protein